MDTLLRQICMLGLVPRYPNIISTSGLVNMLENRGFKTTQRTVQRDLNHLSLRFPLVCDDHKPAGWCWSGEAEAFSMPSMDPMAALVFRMADEYLGTLLPPESGRLLKPYTKHAERVMSEAGWGGPRSWPKKVRFVPRMQPLLAPKVDTAVMETVYEGLFREKRLIVTHRSRGREEAREKDVAPLGIVLVDRVIYLVASAVGYEDVLLLPLHRIASAVLTDAPMVKPEGFDLREFVDSGKMGFLLGKEPINFRALFSEFSAQNLLESPLSEDQKISRQPDGRYLVEANLPDTSHLRFWLRGFGDGVEVLQPQKLREEMAETARRMAVSYGLKTG